MDKKFLLLFILLIAGASAATQESLPPQTQYGTVLVWQSCDNSTYSNITSIKVGSTQVLGPTEMPNIQAGYYQYSFTNTSLLGVYVVNGFCNENGINTNWAYDFEVTTEGQTINSSSYTFLIFIGLGLVLLVLSFVFKNLIFAFFSGLTISVAGVYSTIYGFSTYLSTYTRMISIIILGFGAVVTIVSALEFIDEMSSGSERSSFDYDDYDE